MSIQQELLQDLPTATASHHTWIQPRPGMATGYWRQVIATSAPLVISDMLVLALGAWLGTFGAAYFSGYPLNHAIAFTVAAIVLQTVMFSMAGLYPAAGVHPAVELRQLVVTEVQLGAILTIFLGAVIQTLDTPYAPLTIISYGFAAVVIPIARSFTRGLVRPQSWWGYPTLMVGDRETCERIALIFNRDGRQSLRPLGRFQDASEYWNDSCDGTLPWLGPLDEVLKYAREKKVYWLIIAMPDHLDEATKNSFEFFRCRFPHVIMIDSRHELPCLWNRAADCGGLSAMKVEERLLMPEQQFAKRLLDLSLVALSSIILLPVMALIALTILITSGRPIFYGGRRIGLNGKEIRQWKFRSMVKNADAVLSDYLAANPAAREEFARDQKLRNDPRITRFGKMVRKSSLDELPQLWNVLRGEMSLVGPRPITAGEALKYGKTMREYASVRPGITGMWQVNGRNHTTYEERKAFDRYYVRNWSPWLDIYILARTIKVVMKCEGAY
jgi:Undecaprenyl-phosphate galactose phosphotransferase WbaP